jgi:hypothetical protein
MFCRSDAAAEQADGARATEAAGNSASTEEEKSAGRSGANRRLKS